MTQADRTASAPPRSPFIISRGIRFPKHPDITRGRIRGALRNDVYERKESEAALRIVRRTDTVLELGGGIGYMSALLAARIKVRHVHVFEANPALIPYIHSVHAANGIENVTVHNALLGPVAADPRPFYVRRNLLASSMDPEAGGEYQSVHQVEVRAIDTVLRTLQPTVLVCDIEGAEAELLPAADLSCLRAAIVETHPQWIGQKGVQAVFDTMHRAGLTYFPKASDGKVVTFKSGW